MSKTHQATTASSHRVGQVHQGSSVDKIGGRIDSRSQVDGDGTGVSTSTGRDGGNGQINGLGYTYTRVKRAKTSVPPSHADSKFDAEQEPPKIRQGETATATWFSRFWQSQTVRFGEKSGRPTEPGPGPAVGRPRTTAAQRVRAEPIVAFFLQVGAMFAFIVEMMAWGLLLINLGCIIYAIFTELFQ